MRLEHSARPDVVSSAHSDSPHEARKIVLDAPFALEFFAGSGLVSYALKRHFKIAWANDNCERKAAVYRANHGFDSLSLGSIEDVDGRSLPGASLAWASFPCQDLSLAGLMGGIKAKRSGLVWEWLRVLDEMPNRPKVLVAENVVGLVAAEGGAHYRKLHEALAARGYRIGAMILDAAHWVPQSRPRVFVVAIASDLAIPSYLLDTQPNWLHSDAVVRAANGLDDFLWWSLPRPKPRKKSLADIVETDAPFDDFDRAQRNLSMIPKRHLDYLAATSLGAIPGYKRTRLSRQVLELRFDGLAGCLRTPEGGSSRQILVFPHRDGLKTRLLTARETARLMGAPESYRLPGSYNDAYRAMGDAVAVPVARFLAKNLLAKVMPNATHC